MKMTNEVIVLAWIFVALGPATLIRCQPGDEEVGRMEAMETVLREAEHEKIEKRKGSLQVFLENCIREKDRKRKKLEPPDSKAFSNAIAEIRVLENLTYDECQDADDLYVHLGDWRGWRVGFFGA